MQTATLGDADVETIRYWLYAPGEGACMWEEFYSHGIMGLAWGEIRDLTVYAHKEDLKAQMLQTYPENGTQRNAIAKLILRAVRGDTSSRNKKPDILPLCLLVEGVLFRPLAIRHGVPPDHRGHDTPGS